jgi:hypothetical protein
MMYGEDGEHADHRATCRCRQIQGLGQRDEAEMIQFLKRRASDPLRTAPSDPGATPARRRLPGGAPLPAIALVPPAWPHRNRPHEVDKSLYHQKSALRVDGRFKAANVF